MAKEFCKVQNSFAFYSDYLDKLKTEKFFLNR